MGPWKIWKRNSKKNKKWNIKWMEMKMKMNSRTKFMRNRETERYGMIKYKSKWM